MKRKIVFILAIFIISGGIFIYNHFQCENKELNTIENAQLIPVSSDDKNDYFLMYIDKVEKYNSNIMVKGKISKGTIKVNDEISISGLGKKEVITKIKKILLNNEEIYTCSKDESIGLIFESEIPRDYISIGQTVTKEGTTKPIYNIKAKINSFSTNSIFELEKKVNRFNINTDLKCSVKVLSKENNEIKIKLDVPIVIDDEIEISLKNNNKIIAKGIAINN